MEQLYVILCGIFPSEMLVWDLPSTIFTILGKVDNGQIHALLYLRKKNPGSVNIDKD